MAWTVPKEQEKFPRETKLDQRQGYLIALLIQKRKIEKKKKHSEISE